MDGISITGDVMPKVNGTISITIIIINPFFMPT
jgi:hypothetical protein